MGAVRALLVEFRLEQYAATFEKIGYDDVQHIREMNRAQVNSM